MKGGNCLEISAACATRHVARAFFAKDKAQRIRARLDGGLRVGEVGDPANFYTCAHLRWPVALIVNGNWEIANAGD